MGGAHLHIRTACKTCINPTHHPTGEPSPTGKAFLRFSLEEIAMRDIYQDVTDKIVTALDQGVVPWIKPWSSSGSAYIGHQPYPINAITRRPYSGINLPLLWAEARLQGFTQDRWLTFNQAKKAGGHIRKGEHSTLAVLYKPMEREEQTESGQPVLDENGQPKVAHFGILRTHFLFNIEQTEGLEMLNETLLETEPSDPFQPTALRKICC
jgi:antirestriction protein ArdC